jgi:HlyD family secretion protein
MIRILLVDDQNIVRQGIQALLEPKPKLKVVGTAEDGNSAIEQVGTHMPDIVLMDLEMPKMNGITATQKICQQFPKTKVLVLSSHEDREYVTQALRAGAEGYLLKNTLAENLEQAIWLVYQGRPQIEAKLLKGVFTESVAPVSQSIAITKAKQNGSTGFEKQLIRETSSKLHNDANQVSDNNSYVFTEENVKPLVQTRSPTPLKEFQSDSKPSKSENKQQSNVCWLPYLYWAIGLGIVATLIIAVMILYYGRFRSTAQAPAVVTSAHPNRPLQTTINALGRLEPQGEVITISASSNLGQQNKVDRILVQEGEQVKAGQIIAVLDSYNLAKANLAEVQKQVEVAKAKLAQVKAGAKQGELEARKAFIVNLEAKLAGNIKTYQATNARLEAEFKNARSEYQRHQKLFDNGAISISTVDAKQLTLNSTRERWQEAMSNFNTTKQTLQAQIQEAKATLVQIAEVRPTDVATAQAEVNSEIAKVNRSQAELNLSYVRAPQAGRILNINTRSGETVGDDGIVELAQSDLMYAVAEVYETDISKIKIGQTANITSDRNTFPNKLQGKVDYIGWQVAKKDVLDTDPTAVTDARVIEVKVRLDPNTSKQLARLTNMQVNVAIKL